MARSSAEKEHQLTLTPPSQLGLVLHIVQRYLSLDLIEIGLLGKWDITWVWTVTSAF